MSPAALGLLSLLIVALSSPVHCFPTGPPAAACETLSPDPVVHGGHGAEPQSGPCPWQLELDLAFDGDSGNYTYTPGGHYLLALTSANSSDSPTFRGAMIQGRLVANDTIPAGAFTPADILFGLIGIPFDTHTRLSDCSPPNISIVHSDSEEKTEMHILWTAPPAGSGPIRFGYAVVKNRTIYWANQRSPIIYENTDTISTTTESVTMSTTEGTVPTPTEEGSAGGPITTSILFPYGIENGDINSPTSLDGASSRIAFSARFYGSQKSTVYVNANGVLSFGNDFGDFSPETFPLSFSRNDEVIALYWDDHDITLSGAIYYRTTQDPFLLDAVSVMISGRFDTSFSPERLLIATWDQAPAFTASFGNRNTYQVIIATDNTATYVMFFYQDVQWSTSSTNIGFNAGDGIRGFNLPRPEGSSTFVNVDDTSNTGFPGVYFFRVDQDSIVEPPSFFPPAVNLTVDPLSSTSLEVSWDFPEANVSELLYWTIEIIADGDMATEVSTNLTTVTLPDLQRGTTYRVRVAGNTAGGLGDYTQYVEGATLLDPPSAPTNVSVDVLTSFALNVTWDPPVDNGGGVILGYNITVNETVFGVEADVNFLLIQSSEILMENTTYEVSVVARNLQHVGDASVEFATTLSLADPQSLLTSPVTSNLRDVNITISWTHVGGTVDQYLIEYTDIMTNTATNVAIDGSLTSTVLTGLETNTSYSLVLYTANSNGLSAASPPVTFTTLLTPTPGIDEFLPYGVEYGDSSLVTLDGSSGPLNFTVLLFGQEEDTVFVNANGVLSFRTPFNDFTPEPFPLGFSGSDDVVLAMYWADHDVRQAGNIFYRASTNFFHLNEVGRNISRVFSAEFEPTSLFIATWDGVPSFLGDDEIVNTYQAVIATDGSSTYVLFLYRDVQWSTTSTSIGFNNGDGVRGFNLPRPSNSSDFADIELNTNNGMVGSYYFKVDQGSVSQPARILDRPTNVAVTAVSSSAVEVSWEPPAMDTGLLSWRVEALDEPEEFDVVVATVPANDLSAVVTGLNKGTSYRVRVAGNTERGVGSFSYYEVIETLVDPPSAPTNVSVDVLTSFALNVTWDPPVDNGGSVILGYNVTVNETVFEVEADVNFLLIHRSDILMENTSYEVAVMAANSEGVGEVSVEMATTLSISEPQSVIHAPELGELTDTWANISWTRAAGSVDSYLFQLTQLPANGTFNITDGSGGFGITLVDLQPFTSYSLLVFTVNSNGLSRSSLPLEFTTLRTPVPREDPLLPFGVLFGDNIFPVSLDGASPPINFKARFFGTEEDTVYVNANGLISFRSPFSDFSPETLPTDDNDTFIALYWDDHDVRQAQGPDGGIYYRVSTNFFLLHEVGANISSAFGNNSFLPDILLIATWNRVPKFLSGSVVNTYQAVIATDGVQTYVLLYYRDIQWVSVGTRVGFNAGDGIRAYTVLPPGSYMDLDENSNVGIEGVYCYRVDQNTIMGPPQPTDAPTTPPPTTSAPPTTSTPSTTPTPSVASTTPSVTTPTTTSPFCSSFQFACGTTSCIPLSWVCDGINDCSIGPGGVALDEANCGVTGAPTSPTTPTPTSPGGCSSGEFLCAGSCLPLRWICDNINDCVIDGIAVDESNEYCGGCGFRSVSCQSFIGPSCVSSQFDLCDGQPDCSNSRDENVPFCSGITAPVTTIPTAATTAPPPSFVPSAPTNVSVDVLTSFALNVTWDPPEDNGGGVILGYIVIVNETSFEVEADVNFLVINDEEVLSENTDYDVSVEAMNMHGVGNASFVQVTTLASTDPQTILSVPVVSDVTDTTADVSWTGAAGDVDQYLLQYALENITIVNVSVSGLHTTFTLTGLEQLTSYSLVIFTVNANGISLPSPAALFTTLITPEPRLDALLPFGPDVGDHDFPFTLDGSSPPVSFSAVFFGSSEDTIYVSANGVLTFGSTFNDFSAEPFPLASGRTDSVIALYWDDHDVRNQGDIFYRVSEDPLLLSEVGANISNAFSTSFVPTSMFIATWDRVRRFLSFSQQLNTYQAVIATDGSATYVLFLYREIGWSRSTTNVGFNAGDGIGGFNLPKPAGGFDYLGLEDTSNAGKLGSYYFRVDKNSVEQPLVVPAPVNVSVTSLSSTSVQVTWEAPSTTSVPLFWTVELRAGSSSGVKTTIITESANASLVIATGLSRGTLYLVRVAGNSNLGVGMFSRQESVVTLVDVPGAPANVSAEGVTSFALNVTWDPPVDNGGGVILGYNITIDDNRFEVDDAAANFFLIRSKNIFVENETYTVRVEARNTRGVGNASVTFGTTLSRSIPQAIFEAPVAADITVTGATITWSPADSDVDQYLLSVTQIPGGNILNTSVDGSLTSFTLSGLQEFTGYSVVVVTVNSEGQSDPGPSVAFSTFTSLESRPDGFLPFGTQFGDVLGPTALDGSSPPISFSARFYGSQEDTIYVNSNGVLSFQDGFTDFSPELFPLSGGRTDKVIALYWDDHDARNVGGIYSRVSMDSFLLNEVGAAISDKLSASFAPTSIFVATWDGVPRFLSSTISLNTYQVVIATDGTETYVLFRYRDIQWGRANTNVGFNAGDGVRGFNLPRIAGSFSSFDSNSNVDIPGSWFFRVDQNYILEPTTPAVISPQPNSYTVDQSQAVTFTCIATGFPLPEISWARVNSTSTVQLESDSSLTISESNVIPNYTLSDGSVVLAVARTLMFTSVSEEDSGQYSCVATNGVGADAGDYFLIVRVAPSFTQLPSNLSAVVTDAASFTCSASGVPRPDITWLDPDSTRLVSGVNGVVITDVNEGDRVRVSTLNITATSPAREGEYRCFVDNGVRTGENLTASAFLTVYAPPGAPDNLNVVSKGPLWVLLSWTQSYDGNRPVGFLVYSFPSGSSNASLIANISADEVVMNGDVITYNVTGETVEPFTSYSYLVYSCNDIDCSFRSSGVVTVQTGQYSSSSPRNVNVVSTTSHSFILEWQTPQNPNGDIVAYIVTLTSSGSDREARSADTTVIRLNISDLVIEGDRVRAEVSNLLAGTSYLVTVQAVNGAEIDGGVGVASEPFAIVTYSEAEFQLRLVDIVPECEEWIGISRTEKRDELVEDIIQELTERCNCEVRATQLDNAGFKCYDESPDAVTFRATISGTRQTTAGQLIGLIQDWVTSGAHPSIQAHLLNADVNCPASIDSFNDPECPSDKVTSVSTSAATASITISNESQGAVSNLSGVTVAIIAVAVLALLLACIIVLVVIVVLVRRRRKLKEELKDTSTPQETSVEEKSMTYMNEVYDEDDKKNLVEDQ